MRGACQQARKAHSIALSFRRFCAKVPGRRFSARSQAQIGFSGFSDLFCFVPSRMPPHTRRGRTFGAVVSCAPPHHAIARRALGSCHEAPSRSRLAEAVFSPPFLDAAVSAESAFRRCVHPKRHGQSQAWLFQKRSAIKARIRAFAFILQPARRVGLVRCAALPGRIAGYQSTSMSCVSSRLPAPWQSAAPSALISLPCSRHALA